MKTFLLHRNFLTINVIAIIFFLTGVSVKAQITYDTIRWWNLAQYEATTISNLAADTEHWKPMSKNGSIQRYANNVVTDGFPLKANGVVIAETEGLIVGSGIQPGNLLLRYNMGSSQNGMQMQNVAPVGISGLKAGQKVVVTMKSSSTAAQGIASVTNLKGECGYDTYPTTYFKTYTFEVVSDGDVSWTNSGGIVVQSVGVLHENADTREQTATPEVSVEGRRIVMTCATPGATIWYSLVDRGEVWDYAMPYSEPFDLTRTCRIRAVAIKEGMRTSEVAERTVEIPLVMPFAGRPWILDPESLDRGAVATYTGSGSNYLVNWRWLIDDPEDICFNVYRDGVKLNDSPLFDKTNFLDTEGSSGSVYTVEALSGGESVEMAAVTVLPKGYLDIPLDRPAGGTTESGSFYYVPGDCMVADVDGDKTYEVIMKWDPSNRKDNSESGYTGNVLIDAYRMDGTKLWRIDLGKNIRAGAHYTQLMVYDLDGDGKAEVACKTAPGTVDGLGNYVLMGQDDPQADYRTVIGGKSGVVVSGPEYLTVFSGLTGEELVTTAYRPSRDTISNWGDNYGNRSERYLACVAYLDGERPSLVMARGYYTAAFVWAVDFDGTSLHTKWLHSSVSGGIGAYGEGAHSIATADVDGDGRDEIIFGACALDDDGTIIYRTGLGHGDALHVGDFAPDRYGLEVMMVHEETSAKYGVEMHDALTGEIISGKFTGTDVGRGLCADVDADSRGCEYWSTAGNEVYGCDGSVISTKRPTVNFRTYWDGDLQEEMTETGVITKWRGRTQSAATLVDMPFRYGAGTNVIKYTPCLQADIFGDWREEQIYYDEETMSHLWIFSTPYSSDYRVPTLMHDHHYRMATVWQTTAYNQPPHLSYYLPDYVEALVSGMPDVSTGGQSVYRQISQVNYYNLLGQQIDRPERGVYIEEILYSDGSVSRMKKID